jgi:nifR3 family TIM-barrel protein
MAEAAKQAESFGPDFIDINMGCPAPKVAVSSGGGSALLKNPELAARVIDAVANAVKIPVTVKIRAGWDETSKNAVEIALLAEKHGAKAITVHGRTRAQMYAPPVDLDIIKKVKEAVKIPVIGNGDVDSPASAAKMLEETGCDFLMVGRAAMGNPWIFAQINAYLNDGVVLPTPPLSKRLLTLIDQVDRMVEYKGEKIALMEARKHAAWYMRGLKGAAELRRLCGMINSKNDVLEIVKKAMELNA